MILSEKYRTRLSLRSSPTSDGSESGESFSVTSGHEKQLKRNLVAADAP